MVKAVIQISDPSLSTLVRLELERNGITVSSATENCVLFITDTNDTPNFKFSFKLGISKFPTALDDSFDAILRRPIELSELRLTVSEVFNAQKDLKSESSYETYLLPKEKAVLWEGRHISLTNNEFIILSALFEADGKPIPRNVLNELIDSSGNSADVYICYLRKKLFFNGKTPIITVRGKGYAFIK